MRSNNPIFNRSEGFNQQAAAYPQGQYAAPQAPYGQGYQPMPTDPSNWQTGSPGVPTSGDRMTIDSVVMTTGISLLTVIVTAAITWMFTGGVAEQSGLLNNPQLVITALTVGSLGAFVLSMVNSFKRVVSPALVLAFCVLEGVALGALSLVIDAVIVPGPDTVVIQAVMGTMAAFAGTLAAYKFFNIQVGQKFRMMVMAGVFGMVGLALMEMVLGFFGAQLGLFGFGGLGLIMAIVGLVLGVFMLVLDFDFIEQGIRNGLPERESWRAAFAMTVSLVWIYTNLLRILAILNQD
jgi:uncharacterized YccA/Bax inhibitor family protein